MSPDEIVSRHHAVLRKVSADPSMDPNGPFATVSRKDNFLTLPTGELQPTRERLELHDQWISEVIAEYPNVQAEKRAVVMAGPPGAGKGYVQKKFLEGMDHYVVCDPDEFKKKILEHEMKAGQLDALKPQIVKDSEMHGEKFAPMEFASLVHEESSFLSVKLQNYLMSRKLNLVVDTVLKSEAAAGVVAGRLDKAEYTYRVVSVQTTEEVSQASIRDRWEKPYRKFLEGDQSLEGRLGGRPVPSEFARSVFPEPGGPSTTQGAALWLAKNGKGATHFQQFRRVEGKPHDLESDMEKRNGQLTQRPSDVQRASFPTAPRRPSPGQHNKRGNSGFER